MPTGFRLGREDASCKFLLVEFVFLFCMLRLKDRDVFGLFFGNVEFVLLFFLSVEFVVCFHVDIALYIQTPPEEAFGPRKHTYKYLLRGYLDVES